ncbi:hypothetical protein PIROE2DRAFT_17909, partial [Piromyces sp. E2]
MIHFLFITGFLSLWTVTSAQFINNSTITEEVEECQYFYSILGNNSDNSCCNFIEGKSSAECDNGHIIKLFIEGSNFKNGLSEMPSEIFKMKNLRL